MILILAKCLLRRLCFNCPLGSSIKYEKRGFISVCFYITYRSVTSVTMYGIVDRAVVPFSPETIALTFLASNLIINDQRIYSLPTENTHPEDDDPFYFLSFPHSLFLLWVPILRSQDNLQHEIACRVSNIHCSDTPFSATMYALAVLALELADIVCASTEAATESISQQSSSVRFDFFESSSKT